MGELKPCPFCGGKNLGVSEKSVSRDYGTAIKYQVAIYCKDCYAYGTRVLTEKIKSNVYPRAWVNLPEAKEKAAEAWNRRAGDPDENTTP